MINTKWISHLLREFDSSNLCNFSESDFHLFLCLRNDWVFDAHFNMSMKSEAVKQPWRVMYCSPQGKYFSPRGKIMSIYCPNYFSNCFSQKQLDKRRCHLQGALSEEKMGSLPLWGLLAARWPGPDQGPISQAWQESTHCIHGLQGDVWASSVLFVSLDNSQHLLSTQYQIIPDLQGGRMGGRWPVG